MRIEIETNAPTDVDGDSLVVAVDSNGGCLGFRATAGLNLQLGAMTKATDLTGKRNEVVTIFQPTGYAVARIVLVGIGDSETATVATVQRAFECAARSIAGKSTSKVAIVHPGAIGSVSEATTTEAPRCRILRRVSWPGHLLHRKEPVPNRCHCDSLR